jgi:hypothetical protein
MGNKKIDTKVKTLIMEVAFFFLVLVPGIKGKIHFRYNIRLLNEIRFKLSIRLGSEYFSKIINNAK